MSDEAEGWFDSAKAAAATAQMWKQLGNQIALSLPRLVEDGRAIEAVRWATCAEACFWKATGETDQHDVKDVLSVAGDANR